MLAVIQVTDIIHESRQLWEEIAVNLKNSVVAKLVNSRPLSMST